MSKKISMKELLRILFGRNDIDVKNFAGKTFLCLDLGGGNSSASKFSFDENLRSNNERKLVRVNGNADTQVYSIISYEEDGSIKIGRLAEGSLFSKHKISNFKIAPTKENLYLNVKGCEFTHEKVMTDFVKKFFDDICENNPDIKQARDNRTLYLIAAHPSASENEWPSENYRQLVSNATSIPLERVFTIKESQGAIQYAKSIGKVEDSNIKDGLLVDDLGAYSFDASYVCAANYTTWDGSIALGGHSVEDNLLKIILQSRGFNVEDIKNPLALMGKLRLIKESAYISDWDTLDDEGKEIWLELENGHEEKVVVQKNWIHEAVTSHKFLNERPIGPHEESIWLEHEGAFVDYCIQEIKNKGQRVSLVLIMGGASKMEEAVQVIKQKFDAEGVETRLIDSLGTGNSMNEAVPIGASLHFVQSVNVVNKLPKLEENVKTFVNNKLVKSIAHECKGTLETVVWKIIVGVAKEWSESNTDESMNQLVERAKNTMDTDNARKNLCNSLQNSALNAFRNSQDDLNKIVGDFYKEIYNTKWIGKLKIVENGQRFALDEAVIQELADSTSKVLSPEELLKMLEELEEFGLIDFVITVVLIPVFIALGIIELLISCVKKISDGIRWMFLNEKEWEEYKRCMELENQKEAEKRKLENQKKISKAMADLRSKKDREKIYSLILTLDQPISNDDSDGIKKAKTKKIEKFNELETKIKKALSQKMSETAYFELPNSVINELTDAIATAVYVG